MKIGYSVEGSTDRAFLKGLRDRWCPDAELIQGHFRGRSGESQRREIQKISMEFDSKGVDLAIFMRDANRENWREVLAAEKKRCLLKFQHRTLFAVCDRNVESWLCADSDWIANQTKRVRDDFAKDDPKGRIPKKWLGPKSPFFCKPFNDMWF